MNTFVTSTSGTGFAVAVNGTTTQSRSSAQAVLLNLTWRKPAYPWLRYPWAKAVRALNRGGIAAMLALPYHPPRYLRWLWRLARWAVPVALLLAVNVARADEQRDEAIRAQIDAGNELVQDGSDVFQEYAASSPKARKLMAQARTKARSDTERSRIPAAIEGVARQAASVLGFGPVVDTITGIGAPIVVGTAAYLLGRRRKDGSLIEPGEPDDEAMRQRRPGGAARDHGFREQDDARDRGRGNGRGEGDARQADVADALMSAESIDMPRAPSQRHRMVTP